MEAWEERELGRFVSEQYKVVPWHSEAWWREALEAPESVVARHYTHASVDAGAQIAFTENASKGALDRQTRMKPGRYLARFCPSLAADEVRKWAGIFAAENEENILLLATTEDAIEEVYTGGPSSCMSHAAAEYATGGVHPARMYAAGDLAVAYLVREGAITARAVCWPAKRVYRRIYGDEARLISALTAAGYAAGSIAGAKLLRLAYGDNFVCPYLDEHGYVEDHGTHLTISADNEGLVAQNTNGVTESCNQESCGNCNENFDANVVSYYDVLEMSICDGCADDLVTSCERCDATVLRNEADYLPSVREIVCDDCQHNEFVACNDCNDVVLTTDSAIVDGSSVCSGCAENYPVCDNCCALVPETDDDNHCKDCEVVTPDDDEKPEAPAEAPATLEVPTDGDAPIIA